MEMVTTSRVTNFRLVMLGAQSVGKTSLTLRLVKDDFKDYATGTIGAAYQNQTFQIGEKTVNLDLWDTAGQERYNALAPLYYRTAQAAVVTYDVCSRITFNRALDWLRELRCRGPSNMVILLCGNKVDRGNLRVISQQEGATIANDNALLFLESSAKTGQGVKNMFYKIAVELINRSEATLSRPGSIRLQLEPTTGKCEC